VRYLYSKNQETKQRGRKEIRGLLVWSSDCGVGCRPVKVFHPGSWHDAVPQ
jgi:hypothetical protein